MNRAIILSMETDKTKRICDNCYHRHEKAGVADPLANAPADPASTSLSAAVSGRGGVGAR